jgi:hypothetical protein
LDGSPSNDRAAIGSLGAFINQVAAQAGKSLSLSVAAALAEEAYAIIVALGG